MPFAPPPRTLKQVASYVADRSMPYPSAMKEFIDGLIRDLQDKGATPADPPLPISHAMVADKPPVLGVPVLNVHICGMAEYLADLGGFEAPAWSERKEGFLAEPVRLRYCNADDTPQPFARRGLLCGPSLQKVWSVLERTEAKAGLGK